MGGGRTADIIDEYSTETHVILLIGLQISLKVLAYRIQTQGTKN